MSDTPTPEENTANKTGFLTSLRWQGIAGITGIIAIILSDVSR
jgi:hypothetical protein